MFLITKLLKKLLKNRKDPDLCFPRLERLERFERLEHTKFTKAQYGQHPV
jgi:hypothetical protein